MPCRFTDQDDDVARPFHLTAFPPHATVHIVQRTTANEHTHALERTPDMRVSSATVPRPPEELGEILKTVVTDEFGEATIAGLPRGPYGFRYNDRGLPRRRYWALGLVEGTWQRVSFSMRG